MLLIPDRRILVPARRILPAARPPFWRRPWNRPPRPPTRHRPGCPLRLMADGDTPLDPAGNEILDADGNLCLGCDCTPTTYYHARLCSNGNYAAGWIALSPPFPAYFHLPSDPSTIYYVDSSCESATSLPAGTTTYTGVVLDAGCGLCAACTTAGPAHYLLTFSGLPTTFDGGTTHYATRDAAGDIHYADPNGSYEVAMHSSFGNVCRGIAGGGWITNAPDGTDEAHVGVFQLVALSIGVVLDTTSYTFNGVEFSNSDESYVLFNGGIPSPVPCDEPFTIHDYTNPGRTCLVTPGG